MKKRSLNGWQRLWVVFAVICLALAGAFVAYRWPRFETARDYEQYYAGISKETRAILIRQGSAEDKDELIEFSVEMPNGERLRFKKGIKIERAEKAAQEYAVVVEVVLAQKRKHLIIAAASAWLGLVVAVYSMGWSAGWVIHGFRGKPGS